METTSLRLSPAQAYAARMIEAIDILLGDIEDTEAADNVLMMVLERPRTLRSALAAYLYELPMS